MAEQAVDLRSWVATVRRHSKVLVVAAAIGATAGVAVSIVAPPVYSSEAKVLLPPVQQGADGGTPVRNPATTVEIATSDAVLGPAARSMTPRMTTREAKKAVTVTSPTDDVVVFVAEGKTAAQAEALAEAAAKSEIEYLAASANSLGAAETKALQERQAELEASLATVTDEIAKTKGRIRVEAADSVTGMADASALSQLSAQQAELTLKIDQVKNEAKGTGSGPPASVIQHATPAKRPGLVVRTGLLVVGGALAALLIAAILIGVVGSRDRRMRMRDEIADAIGGPVVGSLHVHPQRSAAAWMTMLADYTPTSVDVLAMRHMLRHLTPDDQNGRDSGERRLVHPTSLTVISLAGDDRAHAVGPQLAAFAAASGVSTRLVVGRSHESAAALFAACSPERAGEEVRPGLLLESRGKKHKVDFTVVLVVVDRDEPDLSHVPRSAVTVLSVSSGAATAEDLARAAVTADESGRLVSGVVVADPDAADRTTGRLLQHERAQQAVLPSRLTGINPQPGDGNVRDLRGGA